MQEGDKTEAAQEDPLENETATHASILVQTIPRTEEPVRLLSMGSQRVGQIALTQQRTSKVKDSR